MSPPLGMRLVAGAWLGPGLGALGLLALGLLVGVPLAPGTIALVVAASLLAGAPGAVVAAQHGAVAALLGLVLPTAAVLAAAGTWLLADAGAGEMIAAGLAAAGLTALWLAGAVPARLAWPVPLAALAASALLLALRRDEAMVLLAAGTGAALLGLGLLIPRAMAPQRLRGGLRPAGLGLLLALAALAGPASGVAAQEQMLALLVALPGLGLLMAAPALAPFRLGLALLAVQAMAGFMALLMPGAVVALGLLPAEALGDFRWALLGAAFLPVFCALAGALLPGAAGLAALAGFAMLAAGMPLLLGAAGLLAAPILAIVLAMLLLLMGGKRDAAGA